MRRIFWGVLAMLAVILTVAFTQASRDIASGVDGVIVKAAKGYAAVDTSAGVSFDGRIGGALVVATGRIADTDNSKSQMVVQDSGATATWANRDSVTIDSTDNKYYDLHIRRVQGNQKVRVILRAPGANDTLFLAAVVLRACQRLPC